MTRLPDPALIDRPVRFEPECPPSVWQRLRDAGLDWRSLAIVGAILALLILV